MTHHLIPPAPPEWPRRMVEDAHGPLDPITLPGEGYPHEDERCRQDSIDADGFREACRQIARLADALGLRNADSFGEVIDLAITRVTPPGGDHA